MPNRITVVQVCDATKAYQGTLAGIKIISFKIQHSSFKIKLRIHYLLLMIDTFHMHRIKIFCDELFAQPQ